MTNQYRCEACNRLSEHVNEERQGSIRVGGYYYRFSCGLSDCGATFEITWSARGGHATARID